MLLKEVKLVLPRFKHNGINVKACQGGCQVIVDSGTSYIMVPKQDFEVISRLLGATGENYEVGTELVNLC